MFSKPSIGAAKTSSVNVHASVSERCIESGNGSGLRGESDSDNVSARVQLRV